LQKNSIFRSELYCILDFSGMKSQKCNRSNCLISQVDISPSNPCLIKSGKQMENISIFFSSPNHNFVSQAVQMVISFHDILPLQRNLITKLIATILSPFRLNHLYLIDWSPLHTFHFMKSERNSGKEEMRIKGEI
jgi:hypothetical protein